jgi:hypothetical protein
VKDPIPNILRPGAVYRIPCDEELRDAVYISIKVKADTRGRGGSTGGRSWF